MAGFLELMGPHIAAAAGEILREAGLSYVKARVRTTMEPVLVNPPALTHTDTGYCAYCAITKLLAGAERYLRRGIDKPVLSALYQSLARNQIENAVASLAHGSLPDKQQSLEGYLERISRTLATPALSARVLLEVIADIWDASELALDLAEYVNVGPGKAIEGEVQPL